MKRFERLDEAVAPDGTVLTLYRHDGHCVIRVDGVELMSTRRHASEERLAELACGPVAARTAARVLIGGLGFGFTLRAALRVLPPEAEVIVVELLAAVIRWNEEPAYGLAADALRDPRVDVRHDDVARVLASSPGAFDAIMLDVDNGADALTTAANASLYHDAGIRTAADALRAGGRLAYWSADPDPGFASALRRARLTVDVARAPAHHRGRGTHALYIAHR